MDAMGDADEPDGDEDLQAHRPFLTPEARAFTGAGLVFAGLMSTGLFQFLSFFLLDQNSGNSSPTLQYAVYTGPSGVLAAAGAAIAWPVRRWTGPSTSSSVHGLAIAVVVVGVVIAVSVTAGLLAAATSDNNTF